MSMPMGATGMGVGNKMTGQSFNPSITRGKSKGGFTPMQMQQFTPEQMQLFQQMFGRLGPDSFLGKLAGGDQSMFDQLEAPALRQFQGMQGQLASRFSGMGQGARRSSGFHNTMNQASSDFAQDLQSQRMGLQNQAIRDLMGMSNQLLQQRPYEQFITEKKQPFWKQLMSGGLLGSALNAGGMAYGLSNMNKQQQGGAGFSQNDLNSAMFSMFPYII